jgi:hypothetical protein
MTQKKAVYQFFTKSLGLPENTIEIERAHRIGGADSRKPRPIIVRLKDFQDKFTILKKRGNLKGSKLRLDEDFPIIVVERRRKLLPSFNAIRKHNYNSSVENKRLVKLVIDKLYIDGEVYTHKTANTIPFPFGPIHLAQKEIGDTIYFFTEASVLSNHHPCNFVQNGTRYNSSEQFYFAQKAIAANDDKSHAKILKAKNAMSAMYAGKGIKGIEESVWEPQAVKIMTEGVYQKFEQSSVLKKKLLATEGRHLVEASYHLYWGSGQHINDSDLGDVNKQIGQNKLGEVLIHVRNILLGQA